MTGDDVTLLLLLEARDMASGVIRMLKREVGTLKDTQLLHAAAYTATGLAAAGAAAEIGKFTKDGIKHAINYQAEMTKLRTQARVTGGEYKTMYDYLLQQGPKLGIGPEMLAQGLLRVESVGFRAKKSLLGLHETAKGMIDAVGKLQQVATGGKPGEIDIMGTAQVLNSMFTNHFKVDSSRSSRGFTSAGAGAGALNKVAGLGDMTLPELLKALQIGLIPAASAAHIDARSTFAALETMTDVQIPASRAAVYLRQVISMIQGARTKPKTEGLLESLGMSGAKLQTLASGPGGLMTTFDYIRKHLAASSSHGLVTAKSIFDTGMVKEKGGKPVSQWVKADYEAAISFLETKLPDLSKHGKRALAALLGVSDRTTSMHSALENVKAQIGSGTNDMGYADSVFNVLFGGARTGSGAAALLQNPARFHGRYAQNANLDKASIDPAFNTVMKTAQGHLAQFHATIDSIKTSLGSGFLPLLSMLLSGVSKLLIPLATWTSHHKTLAAVIASSLFVFFSLVAVAGFLAAAMVVLDISFGAFALAVWAVFWPIALVVGIVALLALGAYELIKHWSGFKKFWVDLWHALPGFLRAAWDAMQGILWSGVYAMLLPLEYLAKAAGGALGWIPGIGHGIKKATDSAVNFIESFRHKAAAAFRRAGHDARAGYDAGFGAHYAKAPTLVSEHGGGHMDRVRMLDALNTETLRPGPSLNHATASAGPKKLSNPFPEFHSNDPSLGLQGALGRVWKATSTLAKRSWNDLSDWMVMKWNRMTADGERIWRDYRGWLTTFWGDIRNDSVGAWNDLGTYFGNKWTDIKNGVIDAFWDIVHWFEGLPGRILDATGDGALWLYHLGGTIIHGAWQGIEDGASYLWDFFTGLPGKLAGYFVGAAKWLWHEGGNVIGGLWGGISDAYSDVSSWFDNTDKRVSGYFVGAAKWLVGEGGNVIGGLWSGISDGWSSISSWFGNTATRVSNFFVGAAKWLFNEGGNVIGGLWDGIQGIGGKAATGWAAISAWFGKIDTLIGDFFNGAKTWLKDAGHQVIGGLLTGITGAWKSVKNWASKHAHEFVGWFKHAWKIKSPSQEFFDIGTALMDGLINGMDSRMGALAAKAAQIVAVASSVGITKDSQLGPGVASGIIASTAAAGGDSRAIVTALKNAGDGTSAAYLAKLLGVPVFAAGGIVTRPTLGLFGEAGPEAIIPLDRLGGGGGTVIHIDLSGSSFIDDAGINRMLDKLGNHLTQKVLPGAGMNVRRR